MRAWQQQPDGRWKAWSYLGFDATNSNVPRVERAGAHFGENVWVWFAPAAWMLREQQPAIWAQVLKEADPKWLPVR